MGVPFAPFDPNAVLFWPVRTANPEGRTVPYRDVNGRDHGLPGRRFLADRPGRHHVGVDLYGNEGDPIVACESGVIVACYDFLKVQDGALPSLQALLIQGDSGLVINYGEIRHGSMGANGRKTGDRVAAGDVIAQVGMTTSSGPMCHFETYQRGTTANKRWMASTSTPPGLYNPTALLLHLAQKGR
jgi:murein DD-endopeptidase MepM/ murein hydrolase activator NlpD